MRGVDSRGPLRVVSAVSNGADDDEYARPVETGVLLSLQESGSDGGSPSMTTGALVACLDAERSQPRVILCRVG